MKIMIKNKEGLEREVSPENIMIYNRSLKEYLEEIMNVKAELKELMEIYKKDVEELREIWQKTKLL